MNPKSFTLDGKRHKLDALIPIGSIRYVVGNMNVGDTDEAVRAEIAERSVKWGKPALAEQAALFALKCHRENQAIFVHHRF